ncbi:flavin monoamine oxidase family protein [Janthinobacterium fluminis]|uniref:Tryptophan 2-monooxygenase n=1 Tax=Janthinobacterium fluminis TaxID=2987524 RepID=A0ABT5JW11_9BURK|nr:FAD-dependent oxidoreductase [Janthinobacterium fluminis]MDC8756923.1 FAD-dependent oxidoreductase [Janthinobacterium fluminis]
MSKHRRTLFGAMDQHLRKLEKARAAKQGPSTFMAASGAARKGKTAAQVRVGIVGGGMAGLYSAMLFDQLGIAYQIFEASGERLGGRVLTHYFNNNSHQYAELGAMRFPENWMQSRLFNFWTHLNDTAETTPGAREIVRIPYVLFDESTDADAGNLLCFNGMPPATRNAVKADNTLLGFDQFFTDPSFDYFKDANGKLKPAQTLLNNAIEPFMRLLDSEDIEDINAAWAEILTYDSYSGRSYLQEIGDRERAYPSRIVDYMESVLSYTGVYDLAFVEMLLDNFSFDDTPAWSAMDGGTDRITQEMVKRVPQANVTMGARVFRVDEDSGRPAIHYRRGDGTLEQRDEFDRVIITLPFSALRFIDTPATWSAAKYEAIRTLKMTNAVKVALGFQSRFWESAGPYSARMAGGQSNTDLPVRSVVYPSFGIGEAGPAYILGSYCWQDDADKFSHLDQRQMFDTCLRHVVTLHGEVAREQYLGDGASVVWNQQPFAGGGFEFFAPGQFFEKFLDAREPQGSFHFAGEHLDMVHYWIAGAYDSGFRAVWEVLIKEGLMTEEMMVRLRDALGGGLILPSMIPYFGDEGIEAMARKVFAESL